MEVNFKAMVINAGRITIPQDIRDEIKLKEGNKIRFIGKIVKIEIVEKEVA